MRTVFFLPFLNLFCLTSVHRDNVGSKSSDTKGTQSFKHTQEKIMYTYIPINNKL